MNPRFLLLVTASVVALWLSLCPPWRARVVLKGDDRSVPWRSAPLWNEADFPREAIAAQASQQLGFAVNPADLEMELDWPRAYYQLSGLLVVTGLLWLLIGQWPRVASQERHP